MNEKAGRLDDLERTTRFVLGAVLILLAWGFGWAGVEGIAAILLGAYALATSLAGYAPEDKALSDLER